MAAIQFIHHTIPQQDGSMGLQVDEPPDKPGAWLALDYVSDFLQMVYAGKHKAVPFQGELLRYFVPAAMKSHTVTQFSVSCCLQ